MTNDQYPNRLVCREKPQKTWCDLHQPSPSSSARRHSDRKSSRLLLSFILRFLRSCTGQERISDDKLCNLWLVRAENLEEAIWHQSPWTLWGCEFTSPVFSWSNVYSSHHVEGLKRGTRSVEFINTSRSLTCKWLVCGPSPHTTSVFTSEDFSPICRILESEGMKRTIRNNQWTNVCLQLIMWAFTQI